jgi:hypothetical protein
MLASLNKAATKKGCPCLPTHASNRSISKHLEQTAQAGHQASLNPQHTIQIYRYKVTTQEKTGLSQRSTPPDRQVNGAVGGAEVVVGIVPQRWAAFLSESACRAGRVSSSSLASAALAPPI